MSNEDPELAGQPILMLDAEYKSAWTALSRAERSRIDRAIYRGDPPPDGESFGRLARTRTFRLMVLHTWGLGLYGLALAGHVGNIYLGPPMDEPGAATAVMSLVLVAALVLTLLQLRRFHRLVAGWL